MWFKNIVTTVLKCVGVASGVLPLIQGAAKGTEAEKTISHISDDLTKVAGMVTTVELIGASVSNTLPGPEKLKAATPLVAQVILQAEFMTGKKIKDETRFKQGAASIASGMADVLSSLEGD